MNLLIHGWSPYLTYAVWGAVLLSIVIGLGLIMVTSLALKRAAKRRALSPPTPQEASVDEAPKTAVEKMQGVWSKFLAFWGFSPTDELSTAFAKTIEILKTYIPGKEFRYEIPWYLMIGAEDSGKTELLRNLNLELPIGKPDYEGQIGEQACNWWFFDRGIVLDVSGQLLLEKNSAKSQDKVWKHLLNLINKHRPKRPLDGIILTIPVTELIGSAVLNHDEIVMRAKQLHRKLWMLQNQLMMKVPVYVVLTKSDALPGFTELVKELPESRLNEIFGWSCPYALDVSYSQQWTYDLFSHMKHALQKVRSLIFTKSSASQTRNLAFLLNTSIDRIQNNLGLYLNTIFQDSAYHESFFLRGVYFTGDAYTPTQVRALSQQKSQDLIDPTGNIVTVTPPQTGRHIVFANHLFEHKIFREADLGQPILHILASTHKALNFGKAAVGGICLTWFLGLLMVSHEFAHMNKIADPLLNQIHRATEGISQLQGAQKKMQREIYLNEQTKAILGLMGEISQAKTWSVFVPASWFSGLDTALQQALTVAYDNIILAALYNELIKKGDGLVAMNRMEEEFDYSHTKSLDPLTLPAFKNLQNYVSAIKEFEQFVTLYNNIEMSQNIDDILKLIHYVYSIDIPRNAFSNRVFYKTALARTSDLNVYVQGLKNRATDKLKERFDSFVRAVFDFENNASAIVKLHSELDQLSKPGSKLVDDGDLRKLLSMTKAVMVQVGGPDLKWAENTAFNPGEAYSQLMTDIASAEILGVTVAADISQKAAESFEAFKRYLVSLRTPLTKNIFVNVNGVLRCDVSDSFKLFVKILEDFMKQSFMLEDLIVQEVKPVPPEKLLFWDPITLHNAEKIIDDYNGFVDNTLLEVPSEFRNILKFIGLNSLRKKVINVVAKSQSFHDAPAQFMSFSMKETLNSQVQNIKLVTPQFKKLLSIFSVNDIQFKTTGLSEILVSQTYDLLRKVDKMLDTENLFGVRDTNFDWWDGEMNVGFKAFGVDDQEGLEGYLSAQMQRVSYYAKDLAQHLLNFLRVANLENSPSDLPTLHRWSRILSQIDYYEQKKPGNSVAGLEEYIIKTMNQTSMNNCGAVGSEGTGDYFLERRRKIQTLLGKRCTRLSRARFSERYGRIATFFNSNLSDRFPFTKKKYMPEDREATLRDVQTFYKLFDLLTAYDFETLEKEARKSPKKARVLSFLQLMRASRRLLRADGNNMEGVDEEGLRLEVDLLNRKKLETQNNFVLRRYFKVGDPTAGADGMTTIKNGDQAKNLEVYSGDSVIMQFDFVKSNEATKYPTPITDFSRPAYEVEDGNKTLITYEGNWAFLHLLKEHKAEELNPPTGVERQWLVKVDIPIQFPEAEGSSNSSQKGMTTLVIDLKMLEKKGEEGAPVSGQEVEKKLLNRTNASLNFPVNAPTLKAEDDFDAEEDTVDTASIEESTDNDAVGDDSDA